MLILLPVVAFLGSLALHALALRLFPRWGLLDFPERYGLTRRRIPYPTGLVPITIFLVLFLGLLPWDRQNLGIAIAVLILGLFCFLDDIRPLSPLLRLCVQVGICLLIFASGSRIYSLTSPLPFLTGGDIISLDSVGMRIPFFGLLPIASGIFTVVWLGLTINALNWFDGISGQVSVLATLGFLTIGLLAMRPNVDQPIVAAIALTLAGISIGGLLFDLPPPRLLMGDTGAMFYGLMLGVLTIYAGGKVATAFLVLGVPLIDFILVASNRLIAGTSPFRSRKRPEHLHHRLLARGWSPEQVILLTTLIGAAFGITALFLNTFEKFIAGIVLFLLMLGLSIYAGGARRHGGAT